MRIDLEGISQRIVALPIPARNFVNLRSGKAGTFFLAEFPPPAPGGTPGLTLHKFDLEKRKLDKVTEGINAF